MRELECSECGEIFSSKDVARHIKKWNYTECQKCYAELTVDHFEEFYPIIERRSG